MLEHYELLGTDIGVGASGRKIERFGRYVVDRPAVIASSPAANVAPRGAPAHPRPRSQEGSGEPTSGATADLSSSADFVYDRTAPAASGRWLRTDGTPLDAPVSWEIGVDALTFELRLTDSGQVGLFPEQADNWRWIAGELAKLAAASDSRDEPPRVLNLFAYTGASTLAAAAAGAQVVHVDAARPAVEWARLNAELSGLAAAPIRWLVDDARAFVDRELRRGRQYTGVILDPPSYGHGVKRTDWRLERDLPALVSSCRDLLSVGPAFLLLTCHTTGVTAARLGEWFFDATGLTPTDLGDMNLVARSGATLPSGVCVRWSGEVASEPSPK
ncbi:MAG: class I SAM-dependent methyltransferase [Pirellulales bacterium]